MTQLDAFVIGAGPSGSSCALALAKRGWKVAMIDRASFPRPKVCGGFLGPQNKELLTDLGIWQELLAKGAQIINKSALYSQDGTSVMLPLDQTPALGVSRQLLDQLLVNKAKQAGVTVLEGAQVQQIRNLDQGFELKVDHYRENTQRIFRAEQVIDASGHRSPDLNSKNIVLGIAALYEDMPWTRSQVSLFCCRQGHVGINPFENNMVNVCYVVQASLFAKCNNSPQAVFDSWLNDSPILRQKFEGVKRATPWKAVYVPFRKTIKLWDRGIWHVGDSAAYINPVTGTGMGVALISGQLLAHALITQSSQEGQLSIYKQYYEQCFLRQRWLADIWGALAHHPWTAKMIIKILNSHDHFKSMSLRYSHPPLRVESLYQHAGGLR